MEAPAALFDSNDYSNCVSNGGDSLSNDSFKPPSLSFHSIFSTAANANLAKEKGWKIELKELAKDFDLGCSHVACRPAVDFMVEVLYRAFMFQISKMVTLYQKGFLVKGFEESRILHVRVAGLVEFQVQSAEFIDVVHLDQRICTCRQWQILGIPCSHVIAAMQLRNKRPYDFCEHWFLTESYRITYNEVLHATRDIRQWDHTPVKMVLPPHASKQPALTGKRGDTIDKDVAIHQSSSVLNMKTT